MAIKDRIWYAFASDNGVAFLYCGSKYNLSFKMFPATGDIINSSKVSAEEASRYASFAGPEAKGYVIPYSYLFDVLREWNDKLLKARITPILVYSRNKMGSPKMEAVVTTCCQDAVMIQERYPEAAEKYFNKDSRTKAFYFNDTVPALSGLSPLNSIKVSSTRFALMVRKGEHAELDFLKRDQMSDSGHVNYAILYSIGMKSDEIDLVEECGFRWNRALQGWVGIVERINKEKLYGLFKNDKRPIDSQLKFIPEWHAMYTTRKSLRDLMTTGRIKVDKGNFNNDALWKKMTA